MVLFGDVCVMPNLLTIRNKFQVEPLSVVGVVFVSMLRGEILFAFYRCQGFRPRKHVRCDARVSNNFGGQCFPGG